MTASAALRPPRCHASLVAGNTTGVFMGDFLFRLRTLYALRMDIGAEAGVADLAAIAHLCRALRPMGANQHDVAVGFVVAQKRTVDAARLRASAERAALKVTRDQCARYLKAAKKERG